MSSLEGKSHLPYFVIAKAGAARKHKQAVLLNKRRSGDLNRHDLTRNTDLDVAGNKPHGLAHRLGYHEPPRTIHGSNHAIYFTIARAINWEATMFRRQTP